MDVPGHRTLRQTFDFTSKFGASHAAISIKAAPLASSTQLADRGAFLTRSQLESS